MEAVKTQSLMEKDKLQKSQKLRTFFVLSKKTNRLKNFEREK